MTHEQKINNMYCHSLFTEKTLQWSLMYKDYKDHLIDQAALMLTLLGRVTQTKQVLATQFSFRLRTPDLIIKVSHTASWDDHSTGLKDIT